MQRISQLGKDLQQFSNLSVTRLYKDSEMEEEKKLSPVMTYFTLLKGFVCTAVLYLPQSFYKGGWLFSFIALTVSLIISVIAILKLLEARDATNARSYMELGTKAYGKKGKNTVGLFLILSQVGFTIAFVYFICSQLHAVFLFFFDVDINLAYFGLACCIIYIPLCWIRDLKKFAQFHLFADIIIFSVVVCIFIYSIKNAEENGWGKNTNAIQPNTWVTMIGFSVYLYEGAGIKNKKAFPKVLLACVTSIYVVFIFYSNLAFFSYGDKLNTPLITDQLQANWFTQLLKILFCINLIITYPLMIHPANEVIEMWIYDRMQISRTRRSYFENANRSVMVLITVVAAISIGVKLDSFLALLGSVACTPIAFTLPALFHYRICALTKWQKGEDLILIAISIFLAIYCTVFTLQNW